MLVTEQDVREAYRVVLGREPESATVIKSYLHHPDKRALFKELVSSLESITKNGIFAMNAATSKDFFSNTEEMEYKGLRYILPLEDFTSISLQNGQDYEPYVSSHLFRNLSEGQVFLDVGANLGLFSLPAARAVGPRGKVLAFEALNDNARLLAINAANNNISNISIFPIALGDYMGATAASTALTTDRVLLKPGQAAGVGLDIMAVVRLDGFLAADTKIDVMKIDVEGYEHRVFLGAENIVRSSLPRIYMEYSNQFQMHGSGVPGSTLISLLSSWGYSFTILHRYAQPEAVRGNAAEIAAQIDAAETKSRAEGRGHLDLYLEA